MTANSAGSEHDDNNNDNNDKSTDGERDNKNTNHNGTGGINDDYDNSNAGEFVSLD